MIHTERLMELLQPKQHGLKPPPTTPRPPVTPGGRRLDLPITPEQITQLEELYAQTTQGEWHADSIEDTCGPFYRYNPDTGIRENLEGWTVKGPRKVGNGELSAFTKQDCEFLAAIHNLFPAIIASLKR